MPRGNPGQPKSAAHRKAISDGVRFRYKAARDAVDTLIVDMERGVDFEALYLGAMRAMSIAIEATTERMKLFSNDLAEARAELAVRDATIKAMAGGGSVKAADPAGNLPGVGAPRPRSGFQQFAIGSHGPAPRGYLNGSCTPVNLDAELAGAERELRVAQDRLSEATAEGRRAAQDRLTQATAELDRARAAIVEFDRKHRGDGDDAA